jgi:hypothetical protein
MRTRLAKATGITTRTAGNDGSLEKQLDCRSQECTNETRMETGRLSGISESSLGSIVFSADPKQASEQ